jgi:hypothetical protein
VLPLKLKIAALFALEHNEKEFGALIWAAAVALIKELPEPIVRLADVGLKVTVVAATLKTGPMLRA